jgi:phospholipid/cholesterol/gamma-HCH transport system substrate-binding protein
MSSRGAFSTLRQRSLGLALLMSMVVFVGLCVAIYQRAFESTVDVLLRTPKTGNTLQADSDVKVRGVIIGRVASVSSSGDGANVQLAIQPDKAKMLPRNVSAQLLPKTLFGERYVNLLVPAVPAGEPLRSGDVLQEDRSTQTVRLEKLFDDMLPVLRAVQPGKLAATLGSIAEALRGQGTDLAATLHTVGDYLAQLDPQVPQLTADLAQLATVARNYSTAAPQIVDGLTSLVTTSRTIFDQRQDLENLFTSVTAMSDVVGGFVNTNQGTIIGLSATSRPTLDVLARYASEFPCLAKALRDYVPVGDAAFGARSNQPGAHVILHVVPPSAKYTQADRPAPDTTGGPRCPYTPPTSLAGTALATVPGIQGANTASPTGRPATVDPVPGTSFDSAAGMGSANSPAENELIAELVAPSVGTSPAAFPHWGSLLLGPALRGTEVTVK